MRIDYIKLNNFRGFSGETFIDFKGKDLIILEGKNGNGKSTIFDAIEWLITGSISRYLGSNEERSFSYIPNFYSSENYFVEIKFIINETTNKIIKRNSNGLIIDNIQYNYSMGQKQIKNFLFGSQEISEDILKKFFSTQILSQDTLSDFVLAQKPQDRYSIMESLLGLKENKKELEKLSEKKEIIFKNKIEFIDKKIIDIKEKEINLLDNEINKISGSISQITQINSKLHLGEDDFIKEKNLIYNRQFPSVDEIVWFEKKENSYLSENRRLNIEKLEKIRENFNYFDESSQNLNENLNKNNIALIEKYKVTEIIRKHEKKLSDIKNIFSDTIYTRRTIDNYNDEIKKNELLLQNVSLDINVDYENFLLEYAENETLIPSIKKERVRLEESIEQLILQKSINNWETDLKQINIDINNFENEIYLFKQRLEELDSNKDKHILTLSLKLQELLREDQHYESSCPVCGCEYINDGFLDALLVTYDKNMKKFSEEKKQLLSIIKEKELLLDSFKKTKYMCELNLKNNKNKLTQIFTGDIDVEIKQAIEKITFGINSITKLECWLDENQNKYKEVIIIKQNSEIEKKINEIKKLKEALLDNWKYSESFLFISQLDFDNGYNKLLSLLEKKKNKMQSINDYISKINSENSELNKKIIKQKTLADYLNFDALEQSDLIENVSKLEAEILRDEVTINVIVSEQDKTMYFVKTSNLSHLETQLSLYTSKKDELLEEIGKLSTQKKNMENNIQSLKKINQIIDDTPREITKNFLIRNNEFINNLFFQINPHAYNDYIYLFSERDNMGNRLYLISSNEIISNERLESLNFDEIKKMKNLSLSFSSAQANVVALCIFLSLNTNSEDNSQFNLLGLDDPFQNMDDINVYSFIDVLDKFVQKKQVIVSTHDSRFSSLLCNKINLESDRIQKINLISVSKTNQKITYE